ncbi:MAG TPA: ABC transporter permease [Opitutaceae bacterium]|jgi:predicted permease
MMLSDLRVATRSLGRTPGYTSIVLATLALGIGVNVSMFTLLDTLLYQKVPFSQADRLVSIVGTSPQNPRDQFSSKEVDDIRAQAAGAGKAFESVTTYAQWSDTLSERGKTAEQLTSIDASSDFFRTFGVQPFLGRAYTDAEEVTGRGQVALLSYALWKGRFGGDPSVLGRTLRLNAEDVTVIGVMPKSFTAPLFFIGRVDLWRPITIPPHIVNDRSNRFFFAIGRLNPGMTVAQAKAELDALSVRWMHDYPATEKDRGFGLIAPNKILMDSTSVFIIWLMYGIGAAVLAVACANIASLQLARAASKLKDLAIRSAVGGSRLQLLKHQMVEPLLLALVGGCLGVVVAGAMNRALGGALTINMEPIRLSLSPVVIAVAIATSLATGVVFGLLPALYASRIDGISVIKQGTRGSTSGGAQQLMRRVLTIGEIAVAIALLSGAGAMIRGMHSLLERSNGWDTQKIITANIHLPEQSRYLTDDSRRVAIEKLRRRLQEIPGAENTCVSTTVPFFGASQDRPFQVAGKSYEDESKEPLGGYTMVTPSFFATLGISILEGENIPASLKADDKPVVLINKSMAKAFWPNESAIGKRIGDRQGGKLVWREVIGVVSDVRYPLNITDRSTPYQVYKPIVEEPWGYLFLSARGDNPGRFRNELRRVVGDVDPDVAIQQEYTIDEAQRQLNHNLYVVQDTLGWFAVLALLLAALGLYGVISYLVAQRTNEIGIRMALGASRVNVLNLILRYGVTLAAIGAAVGLALSIGLNRLLYSATPGWIALDAGSIGGPALMLVSVALVACLAPALRATRINPIDAIRTE